MDDTITFGIFTERKRKQRGITLRGFALSVDISPVYACEIEKGRRPAPAQPEVLKKMAAVLCLTDEERLLMYDLAGESKNAFPMDLPEYIMEKDIVKAALRKAKEVDATDEAWQEFIDRISKQK